MFTKTLAISNGTTATLSNDTSAYHPEHTLHLIVDLGADQKVEWVIEDTTCNRWPQKDAKGRAFLWQVGDFEQDYSGFYASAKEAVVAALRAFGLGLAEPDSHDRHSCTAACGENAVE